MSKCPFGFSADDEEEDEEVLNGEDVRGNGTPGLQTKESRKGASEPTSQKASGTSKSKDKIKVPSKFDADADPVAWFYQNQIKSEAEFQQKKDALRTEARKRLDQIMDKKNQRLMWPSDSEFDDMSLSSGELSELDSDVHSLASVRTCAYSWISKANYSMPAEATLRLASIASLVLSVVVAYISFRGAQAVRPVLGVVRHGDWAVYSLLCGLAMAGASSLALLSANWRSRKMLLASQVVMLAMYGAVLVVTVLLWTVPAEVDPRMQHAMCGKWGDNRAPMKDAKSPMCDKLPNIQALMASTNTGLRSWMAAQACACLVLCSLGLWYMLELCFVERKGIKHIRRHKRNRFTIPWDKIKVVGPPLACGAGGGGGRGGGGACPVGFSSKDKKA